MALPAAALSPDFCACSMRLPASSILRAISSILLPSILISPPGVLIDTSPPPPGRSPPIIIPRPGSSMAVTTDNSTIATMLHTITTAV